MNVEVTEQGERVVLAVQGRLDAASGASLLTAVGEAVITASPRIDVDLRGVTGFTPAGADALAACRALTIDVPEGLHYCTGPGPGRDAMLAAYAGPTD